MTRHLVVMAAGSGGHIIPGLAVAEEMKRRGWSVSWMGTETGMENKLVPPTGIPLDRMAFAGMRGKGIRHALGGLVRLLRAFVQSRQVLVTRSADAVLGMGGYVCLPGGFMAWLMRRPLVLVNADASWLLSNKVLRGMAARVAFGFEGADAAASAKALVTGNPVRAEIEALAQPQERFAGRTGPLRVLVVGGSLGARSVNTVIPKSLALWPPEARPLVVHQTGSALHAEALRAYAQAGVEAEVLPFIDDMAVRYAQADLVVCRAGAVTVSELCAAGVPSVLVPLLVSTTTHQRDNAELMASAGAAIHMPQSELTPESLHALMAGLERSDLLEMAQAARALAKPHAAARVADELERLVGGA